MIETDYHVGRILQYLEKSDLATEPREATNVIAEHLTIAEALTEQITEIVCNGRTTPGKIQPNDTEYWKDLTWIERTEYLSKQVNR